MALCSTATGREGKQSLVAMGAIEHIIDVLWAQLLSASVQERGFMALLHLADGDTSTDDDVEATRLRMVEADVLETITAGMRQHVRSAAVHLLGLSLLGSIATVSGEEVTAYCMRRLDAAGVIEATVAALQAHTASVEMHERGFGMLCDMSNGEDDDIPDRLHRMVEAVRHI